MPEDGLPPLRDVVRLFGIEPAKGLGQNFLFDLNLTRRVARAAGPLEDVDVLEIGPGPGGLTRALLAEGARVTVIERDPRCIPALAQIRDLYPDRLTLIEGDALEADPVGLAAASRSGHLRVVANLPYNIGTALLVRWLDGQAWPPWFDRLTLMFQREVAERIVATPAERSAYGRLAVLCGWLTEAKILFDVAPSAFVPPPKVVSSVVELLPRDRPTPCPAAALSDVTAAAFGQRRKMLRQSLRSLTAKGQPVDVQHLLAATGIDGARRAETLDVDAFLTLARELDALRRG